MYLFSGPSGTFTLGSGVKLAFMGGRFDRETHELTDVPHVRTGPSGSLLTQPQPRHFHTRADTEGLIAKTKKGNFEGVDILVTSAWPHAVCSLSPTAPVSSASCVAWC